MKSDSSQESFHKADWPLTPSPRGKKFGRLSPEEQADCVGKLVEAIRRISNPHRLLILSSLCQADFCVWQLQAKLGRSQPSISNDLILLKNLGLVQNSRSHNRRANGLNPIVKDKVDALLTVLAELD